jgi:hypothetical protein
MSIDNKEVELISINPDVAERVIRYLCTKPYRDVAVVIDTLKENRIPKNLITPTLNYIIRDDAAYSFAALQKILIEISATPQSTSSSTQSTPTESKVSEITNDTEDKDNIE